MRETVKVVAGEELEPGQPLTADGEGKVRAWKDGDVLVGQVATEEAVEHLPPPPAGHVYMTYCSAEDAFDVGKSGA